MAVFTIADLHLSENSDHPMDVFGSRWQSYTEKLCERWRAVVGADDTVVIPGDISWAMHLSQAREDFLLQDALPGKKYLGKGNHDFRWETAAKLGRFFEENNITTISLLYNNAHVVENYILCGTRGWFLEEGQQQTVGEVDYAKIVNREVQRLKISLDAARALQNAGHADKEILVFLHFPPLWKDFECREILDLLRERGVKRCFYGHIHGVYNIPQTIEADGLSLTLISSDYLNFSPFRIFP